VEREGCAQVSSQEPLAGPGAPGSSRSPGALGYLLFGSLWPDTVAMKCPTCASDNIDGKYFCSDCGTVLSPHLLPAIREQVGSYVREHFRDRNVVDIETTEAIAARFQKWGKWFLIPATGLLTLFGLTLALIGLRDFSDVHKAAEQAISAANSATGKARDALTRAEDATTKAEAASRLIDAATARMNAQLTSAQQLSDKVSGLESRTGERINSANKHMEGRMADLDARVEAANRSIAEQQAKLTSTNDLVKAMFSKGEVEKFQTGVGTNDRFAVYAVPATPPQGQRGAIVYMLLKSAPIPQTVQINFRIYVQPKDSYAITRNLLQFFWADPVEALKQWPLEVSYVPDPTNTQGIFSKLSVRNGVIFADDQQLMSVAPSPTPSQKP